MLCVNKQSDHGSPYFTTYYTLSTQLSYYMKDMETTLLEITPVMPSQDIDRDVTLSLSDGASVLQASGHDEELTHMPLLT